MRHDFAGPPSFAFGRFSVLPARRELIADGHRIEVGDRAFDVLLVLLESGSRWPPPIFRPSRSQEALGKQGIVLILASCEHVIEAAARMAEALNGWLCVARHAIHDTPEAGRLLFDGSHSV